MVQAPTQKPFAHLGQIICVICLICTVYSHSDQIDSWSVWSSSCYRVGTVWSAWSRTCVLSWICTTQMLRYSSQRQGRVYMI